ncbi:MAG: family 10 glycosylhydrolase, partial [Terrimicrobiaceae bacterium]
MQRLLLPLLAALLLSPPPAQAELRGAWISSVHNINFPSRQGLSEQEQKNQAIHLLDAAKSAGLNAVILQVRPESDALYPSQLEPWSRYLTGKQGVSPGYDPLAFFIAEGRKRGIEV